MDQFVSCMPSIEPTRSQPMTFLLKPARFCSHRQILAIASAVFIFFYAWESAKSDTGDKSLDQFLKVWIEQNTTFTKNERGRDVLFVRRRPVRAYIQIDDTDFVNETKFQIQSIANSFELESTFTSSRVNMIVATASGIADRNGKPNKAVLAKLGISGILAERLLEEIRNWGSGCGLYDLSDDSGNISGSIVVADTSLPVKELKSCISTGVVFSFGMRIAGKETFDLPNDYIQFLILARALATCDKEINAAPNDAPLKNRYLECVTKEIKRRI